jgi:hypothetical protein
MNINIYVGFEVLIAVTSSSLINYLPTFRRNVLHPSPKYKSKQGKKSYTEIFHGLPQYLQANAELISPLGQGHFLPNP